MHKAKAGNDDGKPYDYKTIKLNKGLFSGEINEGHNFVDAYYIPASGYADCWSRIVKV